MKVPLISALAAMSSPIFFFFDIPLPDFEF